MKGGGDTCQRVYIIWAIGLYLLPDFTQIQMLQFLYIANEQNKHKSWFINVFDTILNCPDIFF